MVSPLSVKNKPTISLHVGGRREALAVVVARRWGAEYVSGQYGVSCGGLRRAIKSGKGDMDDDAATMRRTNDARGAWGGALPPPPVVAVAQEEGEEDMGMQRRTCHGTKDVHDEDRCDRGDNGCVTTTAAPSAATAVKDEDAGETKENDSDDDRDGKNSDVGRDAGDVAPASAEDDDHVPHVAGEGERCVR